MSSPEAETALLALEGLKTTLASAQAAHQATLADMLAATTTPAVVAIGAAPRARRGGMSKIPASHIGMGSAAKRSLDAALEHVTRAHVELAGHLTFAAETDKQFAAYQDAQNGAPGQVGTAVPSPEAAAAWALANGYVKKTP